MPTTTVEYDLIDLNGKRIARGLFKLGGRYPGARWHWVQEAIARHCECDPDEVECEEPGEADLHGDDYAVVGGRKVARIATRFMPRLDVAPVSAQAAE